MIKRETLEEKQIGIYFITLIISVFVGLYWKETNILEKAIEPVIGILLYSMFCQIPFLQLKQALKDRSFFKAILFGNFLLIPLLVWILIRIFPTTSIITLGILLVLLTPCIDYVIVFSHLGKGNSKAVLASTPLLFILQMLLLPLYLWIFLGKETIGIIEITPFVKAFLHLIVIPFLLSIITQVLSKSNSKSGKAILDFSGWLPVPLMALTFFVVIASQIGVLYNNPEPILKVVPIYVAFAIIAPFIGKLSAKIFRVNFYGSRAISFSTSTRNSLVVLPLALALPAPENQLVAVVIVTQTIVEIFFELLYIKAIPLLTKAKDN
ncbi:arsenic resistance protein [Chryseobacterium lactis]|uniref:Arsenical-resistance protein n=2 Tax=Bacteroidota TaxID=976 RepID=A0A4U9VRH4_9SPHI|nr:MULTISPECIES: arsenic resistance protein [Bacteroidota]OJV55620.1 MAG: arsenic resistance protein [Bacteroidetes bacterium 43-16]AZA84052.1 arsenic resistance protein [Chryseobacterium lactis]AZB04438.1 arsenic resistance protein [Chryseobacterium lactis]MCT3745545.1 arsenic resistance protein [Elizabethkingia anophelis]MDC8027102.1 arsenic resistance protein [Elizabethkingia anophelis]